MTTFHRDWKAAHNEALRLARQCKCDAGIEACSEFGKKGFRVFMLPQPEFRQGFELRCEVVHPTDPL